MMKTHNSDDGSGRLDRAEEVSIYPVDFFPVFYLSGVDSCPGNGSDVSTGGLDNAQDIIKSLKCLTADIAGNLIACQRSDWQAIRFPAISAVRHFRLLIMS